MADPDHMLFENGDYMLLEDGSGHMILESSVSTEHDSGGGGFGAGGEGSGNLAAIAQMYARAQPSRRSRGRR